VAALSAMIQKIFGRAWWRYGKPVLVAVRPTTTWTLPTYFAYDPELDVVKNASGVVLPNPEAYWGTDTVYIVPAADTADVKMLVAAGVVPDGTVEVSVLAADLATVRAAHAVQLSGRWYDVTDVTDAPAGAPAVWGIVRLRRRS